MLDYKDHLIHAAAIRRIPGKMWSLSGYVFDSKSPPQELKRLECPDVICTSRQEAERYALLLCKVWIDRNRIH